MDTQLQEIIARIQKEGVDTAELRAQEIIQEAHKKADDIRRQAEDKARSIVDTARTDADRAVQSGNAALEQAGRDLILATEKQIQNVFQSLIEETVSAAMTPEAMADIVSGIVAEWQKSGTDNIKVLVTEQQRDGMEKALRGALGQRIAAGIDVQAVPSVGAGFRVGAKDGGAYLDFSAATVADMLAAYLNPRLGDTIRKAANR